MKIYVAGSIRAGLQDSSIMSQIISAAQEHGEVLTEHIFIEKNEEVRKVTSEQIFKEDIKWLESSDVVIAEISIPSFGVGYELAHAVSLNKPVLCLCSSDVKRISAMIEGNSSLQIDWYNDSGDAKQLASSFLETYKTKL